jgi:integrase
VRELAHEWLEWLAQVRDAKPSTLRDYEHLLRDPGVKYKRGTGATAGRIMAGFGDREYDSVTAIEVSAFLRRLDREDISARTVNKHRQVLSAIFSYACRADTYGLAVNPVRSTDKRREKPPAALDYYEVGEVEALAGAVARGAHRWVPRLLTKLEQADSTLQEAAAAARVSRAAVVAEFEVNPFFAEQLERRGVSDQISVLTAQRPQGAPRELGVVLAADELAARAQEDRRDADAFRLLLFTGLRLGEVLALRWADVDAGDRLLLIRHAVSAGEEAEPKGRRHRFVPLSMSAVEALRRLGDRVDFTSADDYVLCNRYGRRLDPSALRRRYKQGCAAAGLRPVKLHGLRHAAGSLVARTNDAVFVRDFLGHAKLATTDRYVSAKFRPEELERLDRAFGTEPTTAPNRNV